MNSDDTLLNNLINSLSVTQLDLLAEMIMIIRTDKAQTLAQQEAQTQPVFCRMCKNFCSRGFMVVDPQDTRYLICSDCVKEI